MDEQNQQTLSPPQPQVPPQNANPVPAPKQRNWIKWVLIIVFVALLASITTYFVLTFQSQKTPPPEIVQTIPSPIPDLYTEATRSATANWKIYTNTKVSFQLKYPPRYSQPALPSGIGPTIYTDGSEDNAHIIFGENSTDSIGLQVFPFKRSLDELVEYMKMPSWDGNTSKTLMRRLIIDGREARWYRATPPTVYPGDEVGEIKIYFTGNDHGFILNANLNHSEKELNQILSTFRFTN